MNNDVKALADLGIEVRIKSKTDEKFPKEPLAGITSPSQWTSRWNNRSYRIH